MTMNFNSLRIQANQKPIVSIDNISIEENHLTFLFGESGIGKSLLCKAIYGIIDKQNLHIQIDGRDYRDYLDDPQTKEFKRNGFFVFQEPSSHLNPLMRISEQLQEGDLKFSQNNPEILKALWQTEEESSLKKIFEIYPKPYRPSGGEKQRVLLLMAFKKIQQIIRSNSNRKPNLFIFDEPTGSLDNRYRNLFLELLFEKYSISAFSVIIITHDYSIISQIYDRYRPLLEKIHFKELSRKQEANLEMHDFSAEQYLQWLHQTKPQPQVSKGASEVLAFDSSFRIFGKTLNIYKDPNHTKPSRLIINRGEMVYIKAPSGVGKTTLAKIMMGILEAEQFSMTLANIPITHATPQSVYTQKIWGKKAGMVFQHADESLNLEATIRETFMGLPLENKLQDKEIKERLMDLFEEPIDHQFLNKKVKWLSGGQKQRLNIMRTLFLKTDLIILDEPLNGLDFSGIQKVLSLLKECQNKGCALLLISHNEEIFDHLIHPDQIYYLH